MNVWNKLSRGMQSAPDHIKNRYEEIKHNRWDGFKKQVNKIPKQFPTSPGSEM